MSVESSVSKIAFIGNDSDSIPYNIPFRVDNASDLIVIARDSATGVETLLSSGSHYTISGLGNPLGCTVTTLSPWPPESTLTFYREVPATQLTTYASNDSFPAASHERALDKLTYLMQQALRKLGQCFRVTEASTTPTEKPSIPLSVLGLDGAGQLVFRSSQEMVSFLSLTAPLVDNPVATWEDAAERAVKVPDFLGQLGLERATLKVYHSTGTSAGNWVASQADPSDHSVSSGKIQTQAVTNGKLAHVASGTVKGRTSAGSGDVQDITFNNFYDASAGSTDNRLLSRVGGTWAGRSWYSLAPVGSVVYSEQFTNATCTTFTATATPAVDDTIPLISEGVQLILCSGAFPGGLMTGGNSARIIVSFQCSVSAAGTFVASLFFLNTCLRAASYTVSAGQRLTVNFEASHRTGTPASNFFQYQVRAGSTAGTITINGIATNAREFGGAQFASITVQELKV
jgi:hypothetical protein